MLLKTRKAEKATTVLNDLIKINNERIVCYQQAIDQATNLDYDLKSIFKDIIEEGVHFKQELIDHIKLHAGNPKDTLTLSGMIHRAWVDLKVTFTDNTRQSIINFCEYNEQIAQHAYKAALNMLATKKNTDVYEMVEKQQSALMHSYILIKKCHEARPYINSRLVYFN